MRNKLLGRVLNKALFLAAAPGLMAQSSDLNSFQGPGVPGAGVGDTGFKSGEEVGLRYYLGVSGIVDNTLAPFATDTHGNLLRIPTLYGVETSGGAYGVHNWKRAQLGLEYRGGYTKYVNYDGYNGSNHALNLGVVVKFESL